ncbi:hypothetical protein AB0F18_29090 [Streptomyces sp. NPDC029216]|uniref:hypothetical protein n=1 Tax=Streptomyces sp. NPDC029216 TaxID=3154701 RepID=UPI0033EBC5C5
MPTYEPLPRFTADLKHLTPAQRRRFTRVVRQAFVPDLRAGGTFRPGLRVKGVRAAAGVYELTWAPDGRATSSGAASAATTSSTGPEPPQPALPSDRGRPAPAEPAVARTGQAGDGRH